MMDDRRSRNRLFDEGSISRFMDGTVLLLSESLNAVDREQLSDAQAAGVTAAQTANANFAIGHGGLPRFETKRMQRNARSKAQKSLICTPE